MISNASLIFYACIAKGTTVLAHQGSKEPRIEELAAECLAQSPLHHSMYSHTVKKRTYTFLIDDPFVYFAIFGEELMKSEVLSFLDRIKCELDEILKGRSIASSDDFAPLCFQAQFDPIFRETMASELDMVNPLQDENKNEGNPSVDSEKGKKSVMVPFLPNQSLTKKKRLSAEGNGMDGKESPLEKKVDVCDDTNGCNREFALSVPKCMVNDRQKAKEVWKKHVWVVLLLDVFVCATLLAIWLWVCRGLKCMRN